MPLGHLHVGVAGERNPKMDPGEKCSESLSTSMLYWLWIGSNAGVFVKPSTNFRFT
jgi:hypothetical protein